MQYGDKCLEPYGYSGNSPVTLCCQEEILDKYEGDCRICNQADWEFVNRRDNEYHMIGYISYFPLLG